MLSVAKSMRMQFQPRETEVVLKGGLAFIVTFQSLMCYSSTRVCVAALRVLLQWLYVASLQGCFSCMQHISESIWLFLSGKLERFIQYGVGAQLQCGNDYKKRMMEFIDWCSYV